MLYLDLVNTYLWFALPGNKGSPFAKVKDFKKKFSTMLPCDKAIVLDCLQSLVPVKYEKSSRVQGGGGGKVTSCN